MDDSDRVLESLRVQIKKEIVDNYFADRVTWKKISIYCARKPGPTARSLSCWAAVSWPFFRPWTPRPAAASSWKF